jgi:heat shock protein HtpX
MFKRIGLFLLTNLLVVITVSLILNIVMPMLGIRPDGIMRLAVMCGLFGMMGAFISLAMSRWMAKSAYKIYVIQPSYQNFQYREIYNMVAKLSRQAKLPAVPEVGIYESAEPMLSQQARQRANQLLHSQQVCSLQ